MRLHEMHCPKCRARWYWIRPDNIPLHDKVPWLVCIRCETGNTPPQPPPPINPVFDAILSGIVREFVAPNLGRKRKRRNRRNPT